MPAVVFKGDPKRDFQNTFLEKEVKEMLEERAAIQGKVRR